MPEEYKGVGDLERESQEDHVRTHTYLHRGLDAGRKENKHYTIQAPSLGKFRQSSD